MAGQHDSAHQGYFGSTRAVQHRALGYALDGFAKHWFTYAPALPQDAAPEAFDKVLRRRTRKIFLKNQSQRWFSPLRLGRLIIKDPIGALSSDWLARNFDLEVVVLVRHSAAFAASLKRLNWRHPFEHYNAFGMGQTLHR